VTATVEVVQQFADVNAKATTASDEMNAAPHADNHKECFQTFHIPQGLGKRGNITDIIVTIGSSDTDIDATDHDPLHRMQQIIQQRDLLGIQLSRQKITDSRKQRSMLQQPDSSIKVFG